MNKRFTDFNARFERNERRFNIFFRVVATMVAMVFVAVLAIWAVVGYFAYSLSDEVSTHGAAAVIERIWCGPNNKCL